MQSLIDDFDVRDNSSIRGHGNDDVFIAVHDRVNITIDRVFGDFADKGTNSRLKLDVTHKARRTIHLRIRNSM